MGEKPPSPHTSGQDECDRAKTKQLHQEVGDRGTRSAHEVARRAAGGVVEVRIKGGPGGERQQYDAGGGDDGEAAQLGDTAAQHTDERLGEGEAFAGRDRSPAVALRSSFFPAGPRLWPGK